MPALRELVAGQPGFREEQEQQLRTFGSESVARNASLAAGEYAPLLTDLGSRLSAMDSAGIDVQAVSVIPTQYHYWAGRGLAAEIVSAINERIAAMARSQPGRLVGLATLTHAQRGALIEALERIREHTTVLLVEQTLGVVRHLAEHVVGHGRRQRAMQVPVEQRVADAQEEAARHQEHGRVEHREPQPDGGPREHQTR